MRHRKVLSILLILMLVATIGACKKKAEETVPEPTEVEAPATPPPPPPPPPKEPPPDFGSMKDPEPTRDEILREMSGKLTTIYFAYDSSELSETALRGLKSNANLFKANPDFGIIIEGHCDERGTIEYNLALGERRASSVRDYLTSLGVGRSRMRIITYGEEKPVDPGHSESAWSKNRRAVFLLEQ
jgi:peptidoglycan-associated lipoprotein